MKCTVCDHPVSSVKDSRPTLSGTIRRRRICDLCGHRWTTWELRAPVEVDLEITAGRSLVLTLDTSGQLNVLGPKANLQTVLEELRNSVDKAVMDLAAISERPSVLA